MRDDSFWYVMFYGVFALVAVAVMFGPMSCPNAKQAVEVLEAEGYTNIKTTGGAGTASCGSDDSSATGFTATGPTGQRLSGVVCCGLMFKACTVRVMKRERP